LLTAGDAIDVTCESVTVGVVSGTVEILFVTPGGETASASLTAGTSLSCEPTTFTLVAPVTNTETTMTTAVDVEKAGMIDPTTGRSRRYEASSFLIATPRSL
jgi:hypothetical protein